MPIAQSHSGTATVGTTELDLPTNTTTLTPVTDDGIYQLFIDFATLTANESYKIRIYEQVLAGSPMRLIDEVVIHGIQSEPVYVSPSLLLMHGWSFSLQKLLGTDRSISWSIRRIS